MVGGTRAIGLAIARHYAARVSRVVVTGATPERVTAAPGRGGRHRGRSFDLARAPRHRRRAYRRGTRRRLVLAAIERDHNAVAEYHIDRAIGS